MPGRDERDKHGRTPLDVIADAAAVTPTWVAAALGDALPEGAVQRVELRSSGPTAVSTVARLAVEYGADVPASSPRRLFLKTRHPDRTRDWAFGVGEHEVLFYRDLAAAMS